MDETFEVFLKKYGSKRKYQAMHILEACIFCLKINLNSNVFRTRRGKKKSKDEFLGMLTSVNEQRILRYF